MLLPAVQGHQDHTSLALRSGGSQSLDAVWSSAAAPWAGMAEGKGGSVAWDTEPLSAQGSSGKGAASPELQEGPRPLSAPQAPRLSGSQWPGTSGKAPVATQRPASAFPAPGTVGGGGMLQRPR